MRGGQGQFVLSEEEVAFAAWAKMLVGGEVGQSDRQGEGFVVGSCDAEKHAADSAVFVDGEIAEGYACGSFFEVWGGDVARVGPEAVFADEDYVSGVVDYFGEVGVVGWVAVEIEDYVYADDRRFGGGDFGDELGEERSGDREGVVIADGGFIEVDVDDA